jgi:hypothetical protein
MTALTKACLSSLTCAVPLRMRETVLGDTPARSATMVSVARDLTPVDLDEAEGVFTRWVAMVMRF